MISSCRDVRTPCWPAFHPHHSLSIQSIYRYLILTNLPVARTFVSRTPSPPYPPPHHTGYGNLNIHTEDHTLFQPHNNNSTFLSSEIFCTSMPSHYFLDAWCFVWIFFLAADYLSSPFGCMHSGIQCTGKCWDRMVLPFENTGMPVSCILCLMITKEISTTKWNL